ncbi:MAG: ferritin [Candidatus Caldatribacteriota bacterium]|nr:ferritin [Candidatus Caldatribacteriota bacterium]
MLNEKMVKSINHQINRELYSAYLYISMASYADAEGLSGFANWYKIQAKEEEFHAEKMYNYVNQQGSRVLLEGIEQPPTEFSSIVDLFEKTLEHEKGVTAMINDLVKLAREENDYATESFLQWYVTEQVEEEASPTEIIQKLKFVGEDGRGLLMIDKDLATRVFTVSAATEQ